MRILQPVIWAKGAFLTPQHLQAQDRFVESVLQFRLEALNFRPWGFSDLEIDHEAIASGRFALHRAAGLMPDGLPFEIPAVDEAPPAKPLIEYFGPDQKELDVYLAIPSYRPSGVNVSAPDRGLDTRYVSIVKTMRDENSGQAEKPVQMAKKNFQILAEGDPRRGRTAIRVGRVLKSGDQYELESRFAPPLLRYAASPYLLSILRRLIEILSAKSAMLSGMRRQKNQSLAEFTVADIANFWLLYTINQHFPGLRHLLESKHGRPEELFALLSSLASTLTTFSLTLQPKDLPPYDHEELGACFGELDEKLRTLLETVVPSNFVSLPLRPTRPSIFAAPIFEDKYLERTKMYLAIKAEMDEAELIKKVPALVKICSATHVDHLIRQALPGVPLTHAPSPPSSIPIKLDHQYFSLSQSGLAWEAIGRARNLAAYIPGDFPEPHAEIIVLLPESN